MSEAPIVTVKQGQLQGKVMKSPSGRKFYSFQGIPYAKPPLGALRFRAPQPPEPWEGIRDATAEGNVGPHIDPIFTKSYVGNESCLFLNVYTPTVKVSCLPVMFWIHGGGFLFGSGNNDLYGPDYLVEKDVVVVTINYRCGYLGFLCLDTPEVPGNAGLKDIIQALRWVKENISNFRGNPGDVTIFGESAGGLAVSILCASTLTKNMISKAIIQSSYALSKVAYQQEPVKKARDLVQHFGCNTEDVDEILEFLTTVPARDLVEACSDICGIVVEKVFPGVEAVLTENFIDYLTSGRMADVPVMIGTTSLEMSERPNSDDVQFCIPKELNIEIGSIDSLTIAEKLKDLYFKEKHPTDPECLLEYFQLVSDRHINIDTHRYIKYLVEVSNRPIYYYKFDYIGELNISNYHDILPALGYKTAAHMDELGYLFKNNFEKDIEPTPQDIKMRERMVRLWTNFAKFGNPTPDTNRYLPVSWLPVTKDEFYYLNLGSQLTLSSNPNKEKMDFWDDLYNKYNGTSEDPKTNVSEPPRKNVPEVMSLIKQVETTTGPDKEGIVVFNQILDHGNGIDKELKTSSEIKMVRKDNGVPNDVIRAQGSPKDDL